MMTLQSHHSGKFQGSPGIYLINLTSMKGCLGFPPTMGFYGHELGILVKMQASGKTFLKFP